MTDIWRVRKGIVVILKSNVSNLVSFFFFKMKIIYIYTSRLFLDNLETLEPLV